MNTKSSPNVLQPSRNSVLPRLNVDTHDDKLETAPATQSDQAQLQMIFDERMGHRPAIGYDKTAVLLLSWEAVFDDLEVEKEASPILRQ